MPITAVVFDIGGVEDTPAAGVAERWEAALRLRPGELNEQLGGVWQAGAIGAISEAEAPGSIARLLRLDDARLDAFMEDIWTEYPGTLNAELAGYLGGLRPRRRTALLSNSVVGARKREQERYGFGDIADLIVYSHEVGMSKPDPAPASPPPFLASSPGTASSRPSRHRGPPDRLSPPPAASASLARGYRSIDTACPLALHWRTCAAVWSGPLLPP
jgi:hypothetical protein